MPQGFQFARFLCAVVPLSLMSTTATAQGLVTLSAGFRGRAAANVRAAPMLGFGLSPIRWGWGAIGMELAWSARMTQSDSGAIPEEGGPCADPLGNPTTCASRRDVFGESTLQIGATLTVGPWQRRTAPFAEFALGHYQTNSRERHDVWDLAGGHLPNYSWASPGGRKGLYARVGLGVHVTPWSRGPGLTVAARYRWATLGWLTEYPDHRNGAELVLGIRL